MRELTYFVGVSLDGFIAGPDGDFSAFPLEGDHMTALLHEYTDAMPSHVQDAMGVTADRSRFDTVVMGWNTYAPAVDVGIHSPYRHLRQIIATRRQQQAPDGIEFTSDPLGTVRALKAESGGGIYLAGGGRLAGSIAAEIDRVLLKVYPLMLGDGIPLFSGGKASVRRFRRVGERSFGSGMTMLEYAG
ncbi:MAG TPA: dihydrofolate reductase family protein [Microbacterium sp.]|nr:dihydrofolate reductase family protein [Microbacterium sp.]